MNQTYYNDISDTLRSMVVWLDDLKRNPLDIYKMHAHHIHLLEMRACMANGQPIHKDKKINKWVADKIYDVVKIHRIHEKDLEETRFYLEQAQKKFK